MARIRELRVSVYATGVSAGAIYTTEYQVMVKVQLGIKSLTVGPDDAATSQRMTIGETSAIAPCEVARDRTVLNWSAVGNAAAIALRPIASNCAVADQPAAPNAAAIFPGRVAADVAPADTGV